VIRGYYFDENAPFQIAEGLRHRGVDVLTAQEDGYDQTDDPIVLDRATDLGRVLFTRDDDFLREANARLADGRAFATVIYAHQRRASIGRCVDDLELFAHASDAIEWQGRVVHLPL
jgi:hypothetical protein